MDLPKEEALDFIPKSIQKKKDSKRTTFKLSKKALDAFDWITEVYGINTKEVFDLLCSAQELEKYVIKFVKEQGEIDTKNWIRKTFVIDKQSLTYLNKISNTHGLSRDLMIEKMILFYQALLEKHLEEVKENEKEALKIISSFWDESQNSMEKLIQLLDDNHPIRSRFGIIQIIIENLHSAITSKLSEGTPIDPDDFSQSI